LRQTEPLAGQTQSTWTATGLCDNYPDTGGVLKEFGGDDVLIRCYCESGEFFEASLRKLYPEPFDRNYLPERSG